MTASGEEKESLFERGFESGLAFQDEEVLSFPKMLRISEDLGSLPEFLKVSDAKRKVAPPQKSKVQAPAPVTPAESGRMTRSASKPEVKAPVLTQSETTFGKKGRKPGSQNKGKETKEAKSPKEEKSNKNEAKSKIKQKKEQKEAVTKEVKEEVKKSAKSSKKKSQIKESSSAMMEETPAQAKSDGKETGESKTTATQNESESMKDSQDKHEEGNNETNIGEKRSSDELKEGETVNTAEPALPGEEAEKKTLTA